MENIKRPDDMARITTAELAASFIEEQVREIQEQVGGKKVLLALSGGVDSSVVAALLIKAIGKQLVCVHVNHGLLRKGEPEQVVEVFRNQLDANLVYVDAIDRFLNKLEGVAKQHHTLTQILNGLLERGFALTAVEEAMPPREMLDIPGMKDELRRPMMLLVRAQKN